MNADEALQPSKEQAFSDGQRAGHLHLSPSLNPYPDNSELAREWERARMNTLGAALASTLDAARRVA